MTRDYFEKNNDDQRENKMTKQEKWTLGILSVLAVGILVFGFASISSKLKVPFLALDENSENSDQIDLGVLDNISDEEELKAKDTDGDSLSDYDELYFYGTSPYLDDTDSDGYLDNIEIEQGEDPNCQRGEQCYSSGSTVGESPTSVIDFEEDAELPNLGEYLSGGSTEGQMDPGLESLLNGEATVEELRKILIQAGVSEEDINKIDDKTLIEVYKESLSETYQENNFSQE